MTPKINYVVCSIEESKDLDVVSIDELQGSQLIHEQKNNQQEKEEQTLKVLTNNNQIEQIEVEVKAKVEKMIADNIIKNPKITRFMIIIREEKAKTANIQLLIGQSQQTSLMLNASDAISMTIINPNVEQT